MNLPGVGKFQSLFRRTARLFTPRAVILLYHRVASSSPDPQLLCVTPAHFEEHLEVLRKYGVAISLRSLLSSLQDRQCRRRAVVVTFDDGYADNLHYAKPLLDCCDIPATVFVTSGYVESGREFWYDDLERLLLQPGILPDTLALNLNGTLHQWRLNGAAHYEEASYRAHAGWNISRKGNPTVRHEVYRSIFHILQPLPDQQRRSLVDELFIAAGVEISSRPSHRVLSPEELLQLADGGLVEIGAHTVSHPVLSTLTRSAQLEEISQSKARLEEILGRPVTSFAYPFGRHAHYTDETVLAVRKAGFECACSAFPGTVGRGTERWQMPRFLVRDWNGQEFADRLRHWFRTE